MVRARTALPVVKIMSSSEHLVKNHLPTYPLLPYLSYSSN